MKSHAKEKKPFSNFTLLLIILAVVYILSFIIPSGNYARVDKMVDPNSYTRTEKIYLNPIKVLLETPKTALSGSGSTIIAMLVVGGAIGVVISSGALDTGINILLKKFNKKVLLIIPLIFICFGALGTVGVMTVLPFIPLSVELSRKMKVDNIFAVGVLALGAYCGFMSSPISTFTTALAQEIAGLPAFSGAVYRTIITVVLLVVMSGYMCWYAARVRKDPANSVMDKIDFSEFEESTDLGNQTMTVRQALCLGVFFTGFIVFSICAAKFSFGTIQLAGIMLPVALICGFVVEYDLDRTMKAFISGAQRQVPSIIVIIVASGVTTVLNMSGILDSIVYYISQLLVNFNNVFAAIGMFIANSIINLAIPSGSGQAVAVMPIMAPLSDVLGVSRQISVLAFQLGDGFTNLLNPTNAVLIGSLALAKTTFKDWVKLIFPLYIIVFFLCCIFLSIGVVIGW